MFPNRASRITVAVDRRNPPYVFEERGELRGTTIELLERISTQAELDLTFDPVDGPMAQAIHVAAGRADVAADFTVTQRRLRWFRFSRRYAVEELQVFTRRTGTIWPGWAHFHGTLGVKADSYAQEYLIRHQHRIPTLRLTLPSGCWSCSPRDMCMVSSSPAATAPHCSARTPIPT